MEDPPIQPIQLLHPRPAGLRAYLSRHRAWARPWMTVEWGCDWAAYGLSRWAFLTMLQYIGTFSVLVGVIYYFTGASDRTKQKHYQAWQVINTAQGKGGSGGRLEALTELNDDGEALVGVDVSQAFLENIQLRHARMRRAELGRADMMGADLSQADLQDAGMEYTNLRHAALQRVDLRHAYMSNADLAGADLAGADLRNTKMPGADLRGADLRGVQWEGIWLDGANIFGVKNAPAGFVAAAMKTGAISVAEDSETQPAK